ncbi:hypothetical protein [Desulfosporosinus hippei]|uniref:Energy-coupling factor transport system substrate-specific component n=1 Tax=Desulfosporosinus hippei DSM 8344 TaxID=1121419 RepID=A0A1G7W2U3_9FIRM|nr:hypothetical protein [Desulfosporosinus hippei]SDG66198.1 hypothetical protein SAMN05443529_1056 [Desulfosporosinus hippei DSM 8344]
MNKKLFRTDTKALVGSVIIGIVMLIMMQVTGRIDAILDPTLLLLNGTCWAFFTGLIVLMYRQPAGIIAGVVEAVVAMATGYSPLGFFFLFANVIGSVVYSLISGRLSMDKLGHHILAMLGTAVSGNLCVMVGLIYVFHLDWKIALLSSCLTAFVGTIAAGILTKRVYGSLQKSALL